MDDLDEKQMLDFVTTVLSANLPVRFETNGTVPDNELCEKLYELLRQINEANVFFIHLANGDLKTSAPRNNSLVGPVKDLQSTLRHLLWQLERVAEGDYGQKVEFLGDFSNAFNLYIEQVALRERYQAETALLERKNLTQRNEMLEQQLQQQLAYYETLKDMHQRVRGLKHDIKNHCFTLSWLLSRGEIADAQQYVQSMSSVMLASNDIIYDTGNPIFDALLTEKLNRALKSGIEVSVELSVKSNMLVDNMDWCVLLGNALDNAVEACLQADGNDRKLRVKMVSRKNNLSIVIQNSSLAPVKREDGFYESSKKDKSEHGLGFINISKIVEKYDGALHNEYDNGYFKLTCMLCDI